MPDSVPVLSVRQMSKDYRGLRPLRIADLSLDAAERCAILGLDQSMAEVFVDLVTGRTLPDQGEVLVSGQPTTAIPDGDAWMRTLDTFGIVSERTVLLAQFTVRETLTMPFSFDFEGVPDELRARVRQVAEETGLAGDLDRQVATLTPLGRQRLRLASAVSLAPRLLVLEHANATLSAPEASAFAEDLQRVAGARALATVVLTADRGFAEAAASRVLMLQPATGELKAVSGWRKWFS